MKFTVKQFIAFNEDLEGLVPFMYKDSRGLMTVGMGDLIEPIQLGMALPWRRRDGSLATQSEYIEEWNKVHDRAANGWKNSETMYSLNLTAEDIESTVAAKLQSNEEVLKRRVPNYDNLCPDARFMLHSWAWAVGPGSNYPRMLKAINAGRFMDAINECDINPKVGTIILRNERNKQLLTNAARSPKADVLLYPNSLDPEWDHTVVSLQHALSLLGFNIVQDGKLGPKTVEVVKKFQAIHKLTVDGIAGPKTWDALRDALRFR